jgi:hypothetical protein
MKLLGIDTENIKLLGRFTFTNTTEFPIVVSLWQTGPLYYRVINPNTTWSTDCGSVWFTIKVWLYNGENNINPGIKYSLLAGNIVGFAALGALGLGATALATQYGASIRHPDWEEWLSYNSLQDLDDREVIKGINAIGKCQLSQSGFYAGKHPHLYISGGPVKRVTEKGGRLSLEWHEIRVDKCPFENDAMPHIIADTMTSDPHGRYMAGDDGNGESRPSLPARRQAERHDHQIDLIDNDGFESVQPQPPPMPSRPQRAAPEEKPAMPQRPEKPRAPSSFTESEFEYKISS